MGYYHFILNDNSLSQLIVNIIAAILDGYGTAASAAGYYGDGFAAVASERKEKAVELLVIRKDLFYDILDALLRVQ